MGTNVADSPPHEPFSFQSQTTESTFRTLLSVKSAVEDFEGPIRASDLSLATPSSIDIFADMSTTQFNGSAVSLSSVDQDNFLSNKSFRLDSSSVNFGSRSQSNSPSLQDKTIPGSYYNQPLDSCWKTVFLFLTSLLAWKKPWYPAVIITTNSLIFFEFWMAKLSFLSVLSIAGFVYASMDLLLPVLIPNTISTRLQLEDCRQNVNPLLTSWNYIKRHMILISRQARIVRRQMPRVFSMLLAFGFLLSAWICAKINVLLLTYIITSAILLAPGFFQKGIPTFLRCIALLKDFFSGIGRHKKVE